MTEPAEAPTTETQHHPAPHLYVKVAVLLAVLTALEVALYYAERGVDEFTTSLSNPLLLVLAFLKFVLVVGYYMHLRYDSRTLSRFFAGGFVLAIVLYAVVLATFGVVALS